MLTHTDRRPVAGPRFAGFRFPAGEALLAVGDVHGQARMLREALEGLGRVRTGARRRRLVFLGDLVDRGPDSLGCLRLAFGEAQALAGADEMAWLPGNHELMLADALDEAAQGRRACPALGLWRMNGGTSVLAEAPAHADRAGAMRALQDVLPPCGGTPFAQAVRRWPSHLRVGDALLVHAGIDPEHPAARTLDLPQAAHLAHSDRHWAWIREPFLLWRDGWPPKGRAAPRDAPGLLVLHGHTAPARASRAWLAEPERLHGGWDRSASHARVCLDGGAAQGLCVMAASLTDEGVALHAADGR